MRNEQDKWLIKQFRPFFSLSVFGFQRFFHSFSTSTVDILVLRSIFSIGTTLENADLLFIIQKQFFVVY